MTTMKCAGRTVLPIFLMATLIAACGDDDDDDIDTDDDTEIGDIADVDASVHERRSSAGRGGTGGATGRAGAGGSGGAVANAGTGGRAGGGGTAANAGTSGRATAGRDGSGAAGGEDRGDGTTDISLTDAQIAAVTSTANSGEISLGMLALTRAKKPAVRDFAQMMVTMHRAAQARQNAVLDTLNLTIEQNPVSQQLEQSAMQVRMELESIPADQFDLAYIRSQVTIHTEVLRLIDEQLLPDVDAPALRADLMLTRAEVAAHLELATNLLEMLENEADAGKR